MKVEQTPINGSENTDDLPLPIKALSNFYAAFNRRDLGKMAQNWAQSDEAVMDNPVGGIKRGWTEIKTVYERIFNGAARVYVELYDYTLHESGEMFFVAGRERGEFRTGETAVKLAIRTSRIYRMIDGEWRQIHHHGSIENAELLTQYQQAVKQSI